MVGCLEQSPQKLRRLLEMCSIFLMILVYRVRKIYLKNVWGQNNMFAQTFLLGSTVPISPVGSTPMVSIDGRRQHTTYVTLRN